MRSLTLGILGVGHLASYTVKGLRHSGEPLRIVLSPRGARTAAELAERFDCQVAADNQAVIEQSDLVLLAVRPEGLDSLLEGLRFRPDQLVISAMAGVTLAQLQQYPQLQDCQRVRVLPSASAEVGVGPIPLYPAHPVVEQLFGRIGKVVTLSSEALFDVALSHACLHGWSYFLIQQLIDWSCAQGMDQATARQMVAHAVGSAVDFAEAKPELSYGEIGRAIATEGTFTRRGIERIDAAGGLQSWSDAMQGVRDDA